MSVLWEGLLQGLRGVWTIARVVIPLMIVLEIAQANRLLQRVNHVIAKPFRWIGLGEEGVFPLVVAMFFGLTFGSGVIIAHMREGKVSPHEGRIIGTFMALCHALIEDTIIFMTLGAPLLFLIIPRAAVAFGVCMIIYGVQRRKGMEQTALLIVFILVLGMTGHVSAMGVDGDIWYILSSADRFETDASIGYSGTISVLDLGPLNTGLRFRVLGNLGDLGTLVRLYTGQLGREHGSEEERMFIQSHLGGFVGGELSVWDDLKLIGNVGYTDAAYAGKREGITELDYALYRGISVQLGLVKTVSLGLDLFGIVEYAPRMNGIRSSGSIDYASWSAMDVGAQFRLPFVSVKGGVRWQGLKESYDIQEYVGVFLSGGIRF